MWNYPQVPETSIWSWIWFYRLPANNNCYTKFTILPFERMDLSSKTDKNHINLKENITTQHKLTLSITIIYSITCVPPKHPYHRTVLYWLLYLEKENYVSFMYQNLSGKQLLSSIVNKDRPLSIVMWHIISNMTQHRDCNLSKWKSIYNVYKHTW